MMIDGMTRHAQVRLQQRAIPFIVVEFLEQFGSPLRSSGADRLVFDKAAMKRMRRHLGGHRGLRLIQPWLGVYAVVGNDGYVVTVAHQSQRMRRD